jgi:hypothetical protein
MAQNFIKHQPLGRFLSFLVAMMFISDKNFITLEIFQIGAVGDLE